MRGRQINFFAMPDEWDALEKYLEENDMISIPTQMETEEIIPEKINENEIFKYLVKRSNKNEIKSRYLKPNLYRIDDIFSPVIEFTRPYYDKEKNILKKSRLYYTKGFWNDNDEWQEKPSDFLETADKLFKWFRKTYKGTKIPQSKGLVVTQNVKEKIEKEGLKLN